MELPDCPPGAEGYQDSVIEVPKKPEDNNSCTKAEQEFQDHLNSLKIKIDDGSYRGMVERRGRDVSGKWIYLCYPCAAVCSGEAILQTHISGKKHKAKLSIKTIWPQSIFNDHPYNQNENATKISASPKILKKIAEEVVIFNKSVSEMEQKYGKLKDVRCHIQDTLDEVTAPLIGVEYLVEHPPQETHYEPSYTCTLCYKQGHPRTIVNHMTCFWHRHNYLQRHYPKAADLLKPFRQQMKYRDGVAFIMNRIAQRIVEKYGRMKPINIDKEDYEKEKERIHQWIFKGPHIGETKDCTFEEVVDIDLINTLYKSSTQKGALKDPSPPVVAVPKPNNTNRTANRRVRRVSMESLSDLSDELERIIHNPKADSYRSKQMTNPKSRYEPYSERRDAAVHRSKYIGKTGQQKNNEPTKTRQPNYEYKLQVAAEKRQVVEDAASKSLAYHEKNPEKHPLYPEEWKKFWNRRYKEIQAEGKDPSKHDFKPEWIVFWTGRMKELHKEELRLQVVEIYRKMCLTPPPVHVSSPPEKRRKTPDVKEPRRRTPELTEKKRSPEVRRRSPQQFRMGVDARRRSPDLRRRSPPHYRRDRRSPIPHHRRSPPRRFSPIRMLRSRSRSPMRSLCSPPRTHIVLESRGSRSPLSRRDVAHRNRSPVPRNRITAPRIRSPAPRNRSPGPRIHSPVHRNRNSVPHTNSPVHRNCSPITRTHSPDFARTNVQKHGSSRQRSPAQAILNTVLISDDELKPEDGASPWNSAHSLESLSSLPDARSLPSPPRSHAGSVMSRDVPADDVVATLRTLVALEDYLGSLGPKIVDLLAEAIKMEKEKANSSEELLERDSAVVLIETAKEKLKGAAQAGLVAPTAASAVRAAVIRAAATLHEADKRSRLLKAENSKKAASAAAVPVAGVGSVDRAQIAQQMAAALVAQGKTDVSEEELAQLVDAVVGMAEAKKREADEKKQAGARPASFKSNHPLARSGTASALQMLQSAYDDKRCDRKDVPDAMDGLSDSDLETLLKNFNELSAEEQHSLIAYLKKLEAREPQRVERLRQYVSAAAAYVPVALPPAPEPVRASHAAATVSAPIADIKPVAIESDDDDYTVEEVFKSVTEKVKENQIRQEMEIVKKSLEETKGPPPDVLAAVSHSFSTSSNNLSSAANLLALVQASLQSLPQAADVVSSNTQPRSFGDLAEASNLTPPNASQPPFEVPSQNQQPYRQQGITRVAQNIAHVGNASSAYNDPRVDGNNSSMSNESRFGTSNPSIHSEQRFGGISDMQTEQAYGGNHSNVYSESTFGNVHNDRGFGGKLPAVHNEQRYSGNNDQSYGGSNDVYNDQPPPYKGPSTWESRQASDVSIGSLRDQGYNKYPQDNSYNQAPKDLYNQKLHPNHYNANIGRMQENYDTRLHNTKQYGSYDQSNQRGRGVGRGGTANYGNRGRGRGRGAW